MLALLAFLTTPTGMLMAATVLGGSVLALNYDTIVEQLKTNVAFAVGFYKMYLHVIGLEKVNGAPTQETKRSVPNAAPAAVAAAPGSMPDPDDEEKKQKLKCKKRDFQKGDHVDLNRFTQR